MKNIILLTIIVSLAGCFAKKPVRTGLEGKKMPSFNLLLMDSSTQLNTSNIPTDEPIVLLFISPDCPYCKAETEEIINSMKSLSNIRFYILSNFSYSSMKTYCKNYHLEKYSNITVAQDYDSYFPIYFKVTAIPYIAIYNIDKTLKQVIQGRVGTNVIKDIAFE